MWISVDSQSGAARDSQSVANAVSLLLDPLVTLVWLAFCLAIYGVPFDARYVTAGVIGCLVMFPGKAALGDKPTAIVWRGCIDAISVALALLVLGQVSGYLRFFSREAMMLWLGALPLVLPAAQLTVHALLPRVLAATESEARVVICGANGVGLHLANQFTTNRMLGVRFVGFFDDRPRRRLAGIGDEMPLLGRFDDLADYVRSHRIDRVFLALPMASQPRILKLLDDLKDTTASLYFVPDVFVTELINGRIAAVGGVPFVAVRDTPFGPMKGLLKRLEDVIVAGLATLAAAPVLAAVAIGVKLSSPGPVIFRQRRYGLDGREIEVWKFRSMSVTEDGVSAFKAAERGDPRITRFGNFIRRTSLDELPQLINVLQGRMSLVGPRPHAVAMNEEFRRLIPGYMLRHKIRPGLTGWAQVNGERGGSDLARMKKRIALDIDYLRRWSLWLDLYILARTVYVVVREDVAF
jgi:putative colanic acid biosynthesis UDP-glucose lipid carrier transferase